MAMGGMGGGGGAAEKEETVVGANCKHCDHTSLTTLTSVISQGYGPGRALGWADGVGGGGWAVEKEAREGTKERTKEARTRPSAILSPPTLGSPQGKLVTPPPICS